MQTRKIILPRKNSGPRLPEKARNELLRVAHNELTTLPRISTVLFMTSSYSSGASIILIIVHLWLSSSVARIGKEHSCVSPFRDLHPPFSYFDANSDLFLIASHKGSGSIRTTLKPTLWLMW